MGKKRHLQRRKTEGKMRIGLISATEKESGIIRSNLRKSVDGSLGLPVFKGKTGGMNIVHIISGIGKTNASHAATLMLERFSPALVVNFGVGGAYPSSGLRIGDIAVADREIYGDEGLLLKDGFHTADAIGIPYLEKGMRKYFNKFPLDKNLTEQVIKYFKLTANSSPLAPRIKSGAFITVSASTGTDKRAKELEKRFNAICENMEGAAIAHVCAIYGIRMIEIRGISNIVENRDRKKWDIKTAAENCQRVLPGLLKAL